MVKIYCIEDINDLKYVGSTKQTLQKRFQTHKDNKPCSSSKLNLYNAIIYVLEECSDEDRKERERYWINKLDTVNELKLNFNQKEYIKDYCKKWEKQNREKRNRQKRERYHANKLNFTSR